MGLKEYGPLLLKRLDKLTYRQVAILFLIVGFVVYLTGLTNPFQGDDFLQIVNNLPVHSIGNILTFFEGGTFYNGGGFAPLSGSYFRPLMTTTFSLIYSLFGTNTFFYHFVQLLLCVSNAFLVFYIIKHILKSTGLALLVSLIFLVHPINSQVAFSIPSTQDALFFFFGTLGLYFIVRHVSSHDLYWALLCFFASMLSKETGILFVILALVYLLLWDRLRIKQFAAWSVGPIVIWFALRVHAVGIFINPDNAPIERLDLMGRLMTTPSIIEFFIAKFIFPWELASGYYWTHSTVSFEHVFVPLFVDLAALSFLIYVGFILRKKASKQIFHSYLFFATWLILGLLPVLQIIPLDMTACETWFYFSSAGLAGMAATVIVAYKKNRYVQWVPFVLIVAVLLLGARTFARGMDWSSAQKLATTNIAVSKENYVAYNDLARIAIDQKRYPDAATYAKKSISIFPYFGNYNSLGVALLNTHDFSGARAAFNKGLAGNYVAIYENLCLLDLVNGDENSNRKHFTAALKKFPQNGKLWFYYALFEAGQGNNTRAKRALAQAMNNDYGVNETIYNAITTNQAMTLNIGIGTIELNKTN